MANDYQRVSDTFYQLKDYFKLNGISTIIKVCFIILGSIAYGVFIAYIISNISESGRFPGINY
jgi:hypothetical protein